VATPRCNHGLGIKQYTQVIFRGVSSPLGQRIAGVLLGIGLPLLSAGLIALIVNASEMISPILGFGITTIAISSCWATRSLRQAAEAVINPLSKGNLDDAREQLQHYVGRDTASLSAAEILRALLESVSENATDGVFAPLFYSLCGLFISPTWGVAAAFAYKSLSTLDSMVGYRTAPYTHLGWCSARLEDAATWLPCRLTVVTIAVISGHFLQVIRICQRDAPADPSPNSGWSECAYAAALGIQLGGLNYYQGKPSYKPLLGNNLEPITLNKLTIALNLTRYGFLIWLGAGLIGLAFRYHLHCGYHLFV
jgi:adenosylcobinamide-phosphate synthase